MFRISLTVLAFWLASAQAAMPELEKLDRLMAQQLQLERATAALQLEAQQSLADNERLLVLYQQEQQTLSTALAHQQQQQDDVAEQRAELLAAQAQQEQRSDTYQQQLQQGLQLLLGLWSQLPPPLAADLSDDWAQVQNTELGLSQRFGAMVNLLSRLEEFNGGINLHQGQLLHAGQQWQVGQLFIGLGQGYYRLPDGSGAGIGQVVDGQWQWRSAPEHLATIEQAFAIYQGQQAVQFVTLPLAVTGALK